MEDIVAQLREFFATIADVDPMLASLEQGTDAWLRGRANRSTASRFGATLGINPWCTPAQEVRESVYPSFVANEACRYGTANEPIACAQYIFDVRNAHPEGDAQHFSSGLYVRDDCPFLGASPDGIVSTQSFAPHVPVCYDCLPARKYDVGAHVFDPAEGIVFRPTWSYPVGPHRYLLEIKCPYRKTLYGDIPPYYYAQIQGCMFILGLPYAHFYVWTPTVGRRSLVCYPYNERYWTEVMYPTLHKSYFSEVLPLAFLKSRELLCPETLACPCPVTEKIVRAEAIKLGEPYARCPVWREAPLALTVDAPTAC